MLLWTPRGAYFSCFPFALSSEQSCDWLWSNTRVVALTFLLTTDAFFSLVTPESLMRFLSSAVGPRMRPGTPTVVPAKPVNFN